MTAGAVTGRDQRGVALITVLAVIAFTGLVIGALFGLLATSMRVTESAERTARENRAADAAIETAVNRMRTEPCVGAASQPYLAGLTFDQGTPAQSDDVAVDVLCAPQDDNSGTDQVRIVGSDGYRGPLQWTTDCAVNAAEGCLPWSAALGSVPDGLGVSNASLVHTGSQALRFGSGVSVRTGAAALRSDDGAPAIRVGGQYRQGDAGLGASGTDCGMLAGDPGNGRGRIDDVDGDPECGNDDVRTLPVSSESRLEAVDPPAAIPANCGPAGGVVTFAPGRYSPAQTALVNALIDGSCTNRTFHFPPGVYEFRGDRIVFGDAGSFYVFGEPNGWSAATGLVGTTLGQQPDAVLCDTEQPGASIVLNGWTELRHTGGRVAVCPAVPTSGDGSDLEPFDAIQQNPAVPTGVAVTNVQTTGWGNGIDEVPFRCRVGLSYPTTTDFPSATGPCRPMRRYDLTLATDGRGPVDSLRVLLTANESESTPNNLVERRETRFQLFVGGSSLCQTGWFTGAPNGGLTSAYDLLTSGACSTVTLDQSQLAGARIRVDHRMTLPVLNVVQPFTLIGTPAVEVNAVSGTPGSVVTNGGAGASGFDAAANALVDDANRATPQMQGTCTDFVCPFDDGGAFTTADRFVHELAVGGFTWPSPFDGSAGIDPEITSLRALVRISPTSSSLPSGWPSWLRDLLDVENFLIPAQTSLRLDTPSGNRCIAQGSGMNSDQELAFDLRDDNYLTGAPDCSAVLGNMSELENATLTLQFSLPCFSTGGGGCFRFLGVGPIWQFRPPGIEHIRLTAVTDTYAGQAPGASVTIDVTDGASSSAFHVYGRTWLPLSDLTLRWRGGAGTTPVFGGNLTVHGLGSWMAPGAEVGVVCCSPPDSRTVELVAQVDGNDRVVATVAFTDVITNADGSTTYRPGHGVEVLDWRVCSNGSCGAGVPP